MKKVENNKPDCGEMNCKTLTIHGEKYFTRFTKKFENRKNWEKPDEKKFLSVLPGTVLDIFTKAGDIVKKDEKMLVMESMKMQNSYYYPISGKIKTVHVKKGDRIPKGTLILEFE